MLLSNKKLYVSTHMHCLRGIENANMSLMMLSQFCQLIRLLLHTDILIPYDEKKIFDQRLVSVYIDVVKTIEI